MIVFSYLFKFWLVGNIALSFFISTTCGAQNTQIVTKPEKKPPNIVFILVDDLGWRDLSCYGSSFYETPHLDKLASISTMFINAYTPSPVCSPTRAAILTGKYPSRIGITDWIPGNDPKDKELLGPINLNQLPLHEMTIAEALREASYKTFFAGKWHLGGEGYLPTNQGFDINKGGYHYGRPPGGYYSPYQNKKLSDGPEGEYLTDRLTTESIEFMEKNKEDPFFVYLSYYNVHTPIQANKKYILKFKEKRKNLMDTIPIKVKEGEGYSRQHQTTAAYASMVFAMDINVGRILDKLEELDLMEETLIIFTSDNGGLSTLASDKRLAPTSILPLRAGKGWLYEGGIRVPLIIKPPGKIKQNVSATPVISMDFYPTILDFAGLAKKPEQHKDGVSLYNLIREEKKLYRKQLFFHYPHYHNSAWKPGSALRKGQWKLIHFYEDGHDELYNLNNDVGEQYDLSQRFPKKVGKLKRLLFEIQQKTHSKVPKLNNSKN